MTEEEIKAVALKYKLVLYWESDESEPYVAGIRPRQTLKEYIKNTLDKNTIKK